MSMNDSRLLKPGWSWVKFGDVVKLNKDRSADPVADGIERYVGLEHIEPEDLRIRRWGLVADGTTFTSVFRPGQVLFGKRRAYQRKVVVADFEGYVHWMRRDDGKFVARVQVDSDGVIAPPVVTETAVYVYGKGGNLAALQVE